MKDRYFTIEIDGYIRLFEWRHLTGLYDIVSDLARLKDAGFTHYDYKALLF